MFETCKFSYFLEYFYFPKTKIYLFKVLKKVFRNSKYVFEFIRCQNISRNFPGIFWKHLQYFEHKIWISRLSLIL
jgi:hypothetical protein